MIGLGLALAAIAARQFLGPAAPTPPAATWSDTATWNDDANWSDTE